MFEVRCFIKFVINRVKVNKLLYFSHFISLLSESNPVKKSKIQRDQTKGLEVGFINKNNYYNDDNYNITIGKCMCLYKFIDL